MKRHLLLLICLVALVAEASPSTSQGATGPAKLVTTDSRLASATVVGTPVAPTFVHVDVPLPVSIYVAPGPSAEPTVAEAYAWARTQMSAREFSCLRAIAWHESRDVPGGRPGAHAWGLFQAKPGSKMRSAGADWYTNPMTQVRWAIGYARERYSGFCGGAALKFGYCQVGRRTLIAGLDIPHETSPSRPGAAGAECTRRHGVYRLGRGWW